MVEIDTPNAKNEVVSPAFDRAFFLWSIAGGLVLLTAIAGFFWLRYGGAIFFDMLASLQGCF